MDKIKANLFVLKGAGANTAVFVTADGVTVVDTKLAGLGRSILATIKELNGKPVVRIINTHTHLDHVGGNVEFPLTVDIVAHENTAVNMKNMPPAAGLGRPGAPPPNIFEQNKGRGLPKRTFKDKLTVGKGPDQIDLYYFGRGHTNGDAWIVFPALRVVHAGDMFRDKELPLIDAKYGGSATEMPESLSRAHAVLNSLADTVVTGHARQLMTMNDLREYADFSREFVTDVLAQKKAGRSAPEVVKSWTAPAKYATYQVARDMLFSNVMLIYQETN